MKARDENWKISKKLFEENKTSPLLKTQEKNFQIFIFLIFYYYLSSSGISPVSGPSERWCASTLGAALLCSSKAGSDLGLIN